MQTTELFSSSPQQAKVGGGNSLIGTLGAALVLVFGVVLLTGLSLDRTQTAMVRFLAEKGVALVTALESGVRSGTRSRTGIRLQYLVEELADRPDVRFIAVTMPDGTILAHSNPVRVGEVLNTRGGRELGAETIAALRPSGNPSWAIIDMEGSRAFVVFKTFHPKIKGGGRRDEPAAGPLPYVFLGLDLAPLEVAQAQNRERAVLLGAGVLLAGMLALLGLHAVERVRSSRRGQRVAEALAEELAVTLPDGLVVFDAKGRITRMNKAALALLGMEAPAEGKAFLGRKPADVLPSALAELAAKLLREPVLPDTEIVLRHGEEQQYLSVRGGHVNEGYEGRLGSLMFLRDLTEVRRLEAEVRRREKLAAVAAYAYLFILFLLFQGDVVHNFNELRFWDSGRFCKYVDIPTIFSVPVFEAFLTTRQERFFHLLIRAHRLFDGGGKCFFPFHDSSFPGDHAGRPVPIMPIFPKLLVCNVSELRLMSSQSDFLRHSPRLRVGSDR